MIRGLNHLTLAVSSLEASLVFYQDQLGCRLVATWPKGAYLLAGSLWLALIVDEQTRSGPLPEYSHIAFDVAPADLDKLSHSLRNAGVRVWKHNVSEGDSLYILDPDGHKLELHATSLHDRLLSVRAKPWPGLKILIPAEELP